VAVTYRINSINGLLNPPARRPGDRRRAVALGQAIYKTVYTWPSSERRSESGYPTPNGRM